MSIDGTSGSAVAGFADCWIQPRLVTSRAQWSLDLARPVDFHADWQRLPETEPYVNALRRRWELFLRHVAEGGPFPWNLDAVVGGVELVQLCMQSCQEQRWVEVPRRVA